MTDHSFTALVATLLLFVFGLLAMAAWGSADSDCTERHGVLVSQPGFGWVCVEGKR